MPGKYEGNADEALAERLHAQTLDGFHPHELGDVQGFGWYAMVEDRELVVIDGQEAELVENGDLYIVNEDNQGFFTIVAGPYSQAEADKDWAELEAEYADWHGDEEGED